MSLVSRGRPAGCSDSRNSRAVQNAPCWDGLPGILKRDQQGVSSSHGHHQPGDLLEGHCTVLSPEGQEGSSTVPARARYSGTTCTHCSKLSQLTYLFSINHVYVCHRNEHSLHFAVVGNSRTTPKKDDERLIPRHGLVTVLHT